MIRARGTALQRHHDAATNPEGQNLIVDEGAFTAPFATSPAVTPAIDDFGVQGHAERPGQA